MTEGKAHLGYRDVENLTRKQACRRTSISVQAQGRRRGGQAGTRAVLSTRGAERGGIGTRPKGTFWSRTEEQRETERKILRLELFHREVVFDQRERRR